MDALKAIHTEKIDLIFLDIQMPDLNGMELARVLERGTGKPRVIFTTAYNQFAFEGYKVDALDYLLKPITFDRFFKAANKAKDYHQLITKAADPGNDKSAANYFFIKCGNKYEKIYFSDILYIQGQQNYVTICTHKNKYMTLLNLKDLEENLEHRSFIRVHKSYIVAIDKIDSIEGNEICIQSYRIPISRNYREHVLQQVVSSKLWDRT